MALKGNAFLAIWHDIEPAMQAEYMEWHTREHMPERLSIPGFIVGKRLINHEIDRYRYGTVYGGDDIEVFRSADYLKRLNNPTQWSNVVQPAFRNFLRVACERVASAGLGDGGAVATIRLDYAKGGSAARLRSGATHLAETLLKIKGVCAVHIGIARSGVSDVRTHETDLRPQMAEKGFDAVVLAEGSGKPELEQVVPEIEAVIGGSGCGLEGPRTVTYNLAYQLTAEEMSGTSLHTAIGSGQ